MNGRILRVAVAIFAVLSLASPLGAQSKDIQRLNFRLNQQFERSKLEPFARQKQAKPAQVFPMSGNPRREPFDSRRFIVEPLAGAAAGALVIGAPLYLINKEAVRTGLEPLGVAGGFAQGAAAGFAGALYQNTLRDKIGPGNSLIASTLSIGLVSGITSAVVDKILNKGAVALGRSIGGGFFIGAAGALAGALIVELNHSSQSQ
ncbi:MAG: hypothetical protein AAB091_07935 [Elusimicrobiota bacterium]